MKALQDKAEYRVLDLFSGIGAYSLGLERTGGFRTVAFCEIEEYPRRILRKHWPHVPIFNDVRSVTGDGLRADGIVPDWIVGGWPCQGNSPAGTGLGMDDPRSGLWSEIARLAGEIRPLGLLLENSSNLLNVNGGADFGRVLGDLAALGYDAEWHCLPAAAFDAPHIRDRVWIVATLADAARDGRSEQSEPARAERQRAGKSGQPVAHADPDRQGLAVRSADARGLGGSRAVNPRRSAQRVGAVSDSASLGRQSRRPEPEGQPRRPLAHGDGASANAHRLAPIGSAIARQERVSWEPEPGLVRAFHGCPAWLERVVGEGLNEAESRRATETLRALWSDHVSQALWRCAGGLGLIQQAEVLFAFVREYENGTDAARLLVAGKEAPEDFLRSLRRRGIARRPSYRPEHQEQRAREYSDALLPVSRFLARDGKAPWALDSWADATPAVIAGMPNRVERIHALGNLNPPIIPELIGRAIIQSQSDRNAA